jgi:hypothetical protein
VFAVTAFITIMAYVALGWRSRRRAAALDRDKALAGIVWGPGEDGPRGGGDGVFGDGGDAVYVSPLAGRAVTPVSANSSQSPAPRPFQGGGGSSRALPVAAAAVADAVEQGSLRHVATIGGGSAGSDTSAGTSDDDNDDDGGDGNDGGSKDDGDARRLPPHAAGVRASLSPPMRAALTASRPGSHDGLGLNVGGFTQADRASRRIDHILLAAALAGAGGRPPSSASSSSSSHGGSTSTRSSVTRSPSMSVAAQQPRASMRSGTPPTQFWQGQGQAQHHSNRTLVAATSRPVSIQVTSSRPVSLAVAPVNTGSLGKGVI